MNGPHENMGSVVLMLLLQFRGETGFAVEDCTFAGNRIDAFQHQQLHLGLVGSEILLVHHKGGFGVSTGPVLYGLRK